MSKQQQALQNRAHQAISKELHSNEDFDHKKTEQTSSTSKPISPHVVLRQDQKVYETFVNRDDWNTHFLIEAPVYGSLLAKITNLFCNNVDSVMCGGCIIYTNQLSSDGICKNLKKSFQDVAISQNKKDVLNGLHKIKSGQLKILIICLEQLLPFENYYLPNNVNFVVFKSLPENKTTYEYLIRKEKNTNEKYQGAIVSFVTKYQFTLNFQEIESKYQIKFTKTSQTSSQGIKDCFKIEKKTKYSSELEKKQSKASLYKNKELENNQSQQSFLNGHPLRNQLNWATHIMVQYIHDSNAIKCEQAIVLNLINTFESCVIYTKDQQNLTQLVKMLANKQVSFGVVGTNELQKGMQSLESNEKRVLIIGNNLIDTNRKQMLPQSVGLSINWEIGDNLQFYLKKNSKSIDSNSRKGLVVTFIKQKDAQASQKLLCEISQKYKINFIKISPNVKNFDKISLLKYFPQKIVKQASSVSNLKLENSIWNDQKDQNKQKKLKDQDLFQNEKNKSLARQSNYQQKEQKSGQFEVRKDDYAVDKYSFDQNQKSDKQKISKSVEAKKQIGNPTFCEQKVSEDKNNSVDADANDKNNDSDDNSSKKQIQIEPEDLASKPIDNQNQPESLPQLSQQNINSFVNQFLQTQQQQAINFQYPQHQQSQDQQQQKPLSQQHKQNNQPSFQQQSNQQQLQQKSQLQSLSIQNQLPSSQIQINQHHFPNPIDEKMSLNNITQNLDKIAPEIPNKQNQQQIRKKNKEIQDARQQKKMLLIKIEAEVNNNSSQIRKMNEMIGTVSQIQKNNQQQNQTYQTELASQVSQNQITLSLIQNQVQSIKQQNSSTTNKIHQNQQKIESTLQLLLKQGKQSAIQSQQGQLNIQSSINKLITKQSEESKILNSTMQKIQNSFQTINQENNLKLDQTVKQNKIRMSNQNKIYQLQFQQLSLAVKQNKNSTAKQNLINKIQAIKQELNKQRQKTNKLSLQKIQNDKKFKQNSDEIIKLTELNKTLSKNNEILSDQKSKLTKELSQKVKNLAQNSQKNKSLLKNYEQKVKQLESSNTNLTNSQIQRKQFETKYNHKKDESSQLNQQNVLLKGSEKNAKQRLLKIFQSKQEEQRKFGLFKSNSSLRNQIGSLKIYEIIQQYVEPAISNIRQTNKIMTEFSSQTLLPITNLIFSQDTNLLNKLNGFVKRLAPINKELANLLEINKKLIEQLIKQNKNKLQFEAKVEQLKKSLQEHWKNGKELNVFTSEYITKQTEKYLDQFNNLILKAKSAYDQIQKELDTKIDELQKKKTQLLNKQAQLKRAEKRHQQQIQRLKRQNQIQINYYSQDLQLAREENNKLNKSNTQLTTKLETSKFNLIRLQNNYSSLQNTSAQRLIQLQQTHQQKEETLHRQANENQSNLKRDLEIKHSEDLQQQKISLKNHYDLVLGQVEVNHQEDKKCLLRKFSDFQNRLNIKIKQSLKVDLNISSKNFIQKLSELPNIISSIRIMPESTIYNLLDPEFKNFILSSIKETVPKNITHTRTLFVGYQNSVFQKWLTLVQDFQNILVLIKLTNGHIIGGFSQDPYTKNNKGKGQGFMMSVSNQIIYKVKPQGYGRVLKRDEYFFVFGNDELVLKYKENKPVYSVIFDKTNLFFETKGKNIKDFLGTDQEDGECQRIQFHQVFFK